MSTLHSQWLSLHAKIAVAAVITGGVVGLYVYHSGGGTNPHGAPIRSGCIIGSVAYFFCSPVGDHLAT
jgi:hypothetical protein